MNRRAEELLDRHGNAILRYAYSYLHNMSDAEEVLQDTMIQFLKAAPQFDGPSHEKAWLLRGAGNLSKNRLDYNARRSTDELKEELAAQGREDLSFVWEAVKQLPQEQRACIHLFYYEGYPTGDVARMRGRKESPIRSDLRRGAGPHGLLRLGVRGLPHPRRRAQLWHPRVPSAQGHRPA